MVKKLLVFMLLFCAYLNAQTRVGQRTYSKATTGTDTGINISGSGILFHVLTWTHSGTISTCSVQVDSSSDGVTWTSAGTVSPQTCTSDGTSGAVQVATNYIRINIVTLTGGGTITATWSGFLTNPNVPISPTFNWETPGTGDSGKWQAYFYTTATVTKVYCNTDGLGTVTINLNIRPEDQPNTSATDVLNAGLVCTGSGTSTTTILNGSLPGTATFGYILTPTISATSGSPGRITIAVITQ